MVQIRTLLRVEDSAINSNAGTTAVIPDCLHQGKTTGTLPSGHLTGPVVQPVSHHPSLTSPLATLTSLRFLKGVGLAYPPEPQHFLSSPCSMTLRLLHLLSLAHFFFQSRPRCTWAGRPPLTPETRPAPSSGLPQHPEHAPSHV